MLSCEPIAAGLREMFAEFAAEPTSDPPNHRDSTASTPQSPGRTRPRLL